MKLLLKGGAVLAAGLLFVALFAVLLSSMAGENPAAAGCGGPPPPPGPGGTTQFEDLDDVQLGNADLIIGVGEEMAVPSRGWLVAISTTLQESSIRNLANDGSSAELTSEQAAITAESLNYPHDGIGSNYDSVNSFQQRWISGWGSIPELMDRTYAATAFYEALLEVDGWESMSVAEAAQSVQRSAFPDAYADHETEGRVLASVLTGQSPGALGCDLDAPGTPGSAQNVLDKAERTFSARGEVDGTTATIETGSAQDAWAVAAWAVAHAEVESVTTVTVDGRTWSREGGHDTGWTAATEPGAAPAAVVVRVAQDVG